MRSFKKTFGTEGEKHARAFLEQKGYTFVAKNLATPRGEIDLIFRDGNTLVFTEVKTMTEGAIALYGRGALKLTREKIRHLTRAARLFLAQNESSFQNCEMRFDVVEVTLTKREVSFCHIKNAFEADYGYSRKKVF